MEFKNIQERINEERFTTNQNNLNSGITQYSSSKLMIQDIMPSVTEFFKHVGILIKQSGFKRRIANKIRSMVRRDLNYELEQIDSQALELQRLKKQIAEMTRVITELGGTIHSEPFSRCSNRPKVVIMHKSVFVHDAIGNDIEMMYKTLSECYECYVYAETRNNPNVQYISLNKLKEIISDKSALIIFHHSIKWDEGVNLLREAECRIIFKYHNITPENYFSKINKISYRLCKEGRCQTTDLQMLFPSAFWMCDSKYNMEDVNLIADKQKAVCPPFNKVSEWETIVPDDSIKQKLNSDESVNLLFVGRVAPNKGHLMMIDVLKCYVDHYGPNIRLNIIGKSDPALGKYNNALRNKIESYKLNNNISFIGEISDSQLAAYYRYSDVFLSCSEHEGFFVPAIEAQYFELPVVALRSSAVPETLGENQLLLGNDPAAMAAAIRVLCTDAEIKNFVVSNGRKNYQSRFTNDAIEKIFKSEFNLFYNL